MRKPQKELSLLLEKKGFIPIEVDGLIKDIIHYLPSMKFCSRTKINQELEELGWGIGTIDSVTYKAILSMI
jgi:hypothetical protein